MIERIGVDTLGKLTDGDHDTTGIPYIEDNKIANSTWEESFSSLSLLTNPSLCLIMISCLFSSIIYSKY
jgi:hypothetical protein